MIPLSLDDTIDLTKTYGSPFYLFDHLEFIKNFYNLKSAMKSLYPKYQIAYSYKTNYMPYLCKLIKQMGGYAEVVSNFEYQIAKRIGYRDESIIFNGPNKGRAGIEALLSGCILNVDHLQELHEICSAIRQYPERQFQIGLRVNVDIGQGFLSRFGMDEDDIEEAFKIVDGIPNLSIVGFHCHISRFRELNAWHKRTVTMLSLADRFFNDNPPKYIDLGSGMYGMMEPELGMQFEDVPTYEEYAEETAGIMADHYQYYKEDDKPLLFTEPGTTLISNYMVFVGKVDAIKTIRGKTFIVMNCSIHNLGEICTLKKIPISVIHSGNSPEMICDADIVGYTCLEQDVMCRHFYGELEVGDYIEFGNVGGYSIVNKPPFIQPNCSVAARIGDGKYQEIKRSEHIDDICGTYLF